MRLGRARHCSAVEDHTRLVLRMQAAGTHLGQQHLGRHIQAAPAFRTLAVAQDIHIHQQPVAAVLAAALSIVLLRLQLLQRFLQHRTRRLVRHSDLVSFWHLQRQERAVTGLGHWDPSCPGLWGRTEKSRCGGQSR